MSTSGPSTPLKGIAVLGYTVTPLHPGVGRAPGTVDLPVQRDPFGYPIVFASSVKGALKAECGRRAGSGVNCFDNRGRIDCKKDDCAICCCLFGHEPESDEAAAGILSVLDFIPLFIPVPSLSHGYLYITSPYLARRAHTVLETIGDVGDEALDKLKELLDNIVKVEVTKPLSCAGSDVHITTDKIEAGELNSCNNLESLGKTLRGLAEDIHKRLVVVSDDVAPLYIEKGLIRVTRVRLKLSTKTVEQRGLWTEEYIPQGTVFLGGFIATLPKRNKYCTSIEKIREPSESDIILSDHLHILLGKFYNIMGLSNNVTYAVIGGKETIGRGLVKLILALPYAKQGRGRS